MAKKIPLPTTSPLVANTAAGIIETQRQEALLQTGAVQSAAELERTEKAQRVSEQRYRTLFESIDEGFCIIEKMGGGAGEPLDFRYIEANPAFALQSGLRDVTGKTLREVIPDEFEKWLVTYDAILTTGEPIRCERGLLAQGRVLELYAFRVEDETRLRVAINCKDITERKRAVAVLCESEAFTRSIIKSSPDCIKVLDLEGNLLSMESGQELLGIEDIQPFLNKSWIEFWQGGHRQAARAAVALAVTGATGRFVGFFRTLRGEPKWWDVSISPILDAQGHPARLLAVSRDVTARRQAEMNFEFLASVSLDLVHISNVGELMQTVGAKISGYLQLSLCAFVEVSETAGQVVIHHDWHREEVPSLVGVYRLADFVEPEFIQVARAGEVIVVRNVAADTRTDPEKFAALKIASFICVPLIRDGQWRFALSLYHSVAYDWRADEIELARELTARIWTRLERLRAEAALRESEERVRQALDSAELGTWNVNPVTGLFASDERFQAIFGISVEGLNEVQALANIHPSDHARIQEAVTAATRLDDPAPYEVEYRVTHSDGSLHWVFAKGRANFSGLGTARRLLSFAGTVEDITERKQAEEVLRQRTAQFETLLNEVPLGVYLVDASLRVRHVNPAALSAFGNIPDLIGSDLDEVMHNAWPKAKADEIIHRFRHTLETGEPCFVPEMIEKRADRQATEYYEWQINRIALPEGGFGVVCYFRDIAERKRKEEAMRESEERYRNLFNSMDEGFCIIEMIFDAQQKAVDWQFLEVNPSFEKQSGLPEIAGKRMRELAPDHEEYWFEIYGKVALTGEPVRFVNQAKAMEGRWFDLYAFRIGGEQSRRVAVLFTDITERKQSESNLKNAMASAEKANRAKSDFLSSMSHELRTPLNAILGFAQFMQSGSPPPTALQKRSLDQILKGGWYLLELINEILDLALIESGKVTLSWESVSLVEVLRECRALIELQAQARGIGLTFPSFETPAFVHADRKRVKQVLLNFLSNAIKYNKSGGAVVVECTMKPPDFMRISVRDTGEGLAAQQLAQLFQPFNRLGKEGSVEEGTGIGLVVTKRLVELMGGVIGAESTVGVGSVFWMELYLTTARQITLVDQALRAQPPSQAWASPRTVLYVEDNPANLELVEQLIARRADLHLLSAVNGSLGIEFARDHLPDVILLDISLPDINGLDVLKTLRDDPATAHIPVLAISAYAMPHNIEKGLEAGFLRYLTKPINVNEFMEALDRALAFAASAPGDRTGAFAPVPGQVGGKGDVGHADSL